MVRWMLIPAALLTFQAHAEIYKCQDAKGKITYQQTPCAKGMVGTVEEAPPVSEENRQRAQEELDRMQEANRQSDARREQEWQQKQEELKRAEQEEREQQAREEAQRGYWYPWPQTSPWYYPRSHNTHRGHDSKPQPSPQRDKRICTPQYVGDTGCN